VSLPLCFPDRLLIPLCAEHSMTWVRMGEPGGHAFAMHLWQECRSAMGSWHDDPQDVAAVSAGAVDECSQNVARPTDNGIHW